MAEAPLLFVNVGWQTHYAGTKGDPTTGGFAYLREHDMGHEAWNFLSSQGKVYGYIPRETTVSLSTPVKFDPPSASIN